MQLYPILLVAIIAIADGGMSQDLLDGRRDWLTVTIVLAPLALAVAAVAVVTRWSLISVDRGNGWSLVRVGRAMTIGKVVILLTHASALLLFGWLELVRSVVGDQVLLDELICLAPPIVALVGLWFVQYPMERRLREALYYRHVADGRTVYPVPTLGDHIMLQLRTGLLLMLVPALLIFGLVEVVHQAIDVEWAATHQAAVEGLKLVIVAMVFLFAPYIIRLILHVQPLGDGPIRDRLMAICRRHRFRIREILIWHTGGSMINAAVMGLIAPVRYVMMTDALLESMSGDEVEAVMAHEIAHGVRHHMPWLAMALLSALLATVTIVQLVFMLLGEVGVDILVPAPGSLFELVLIFGQFGIALLAFGWVSRRFERQADSFAVQHLSGMGAPASPADLLVNDESVAVMCGALERVAELNAHDPERRSWLHGSIRWRQAYLVSIAGCPVAGLRIDRIVKRIKRVILLVLIAMLSFEVLFNTNLIIDSTSTAPPSMVVSETTSP